MDTKITFKPTGRIVTVRPGTTVLACARQNRIHIPSRCGGKAGCMMCKIQVDEQYAGFLSPLTGAERHKLGPLAEAGTRLACQAQVRGPAVITVPEDRLKAAVQKQLQAQAEEDSLW